MMQRMMGYISYLTEVGGHGVVSTPDGLSMMFYDVMIDVFMIEYIYIYI
jgi:hypothetical protein